MVKIITRNQYHAKKWKKIFGADDCPFCGIEARTDEESIKWIWKQWYILHNTGSYSWNEDHLMAVPHRHVQFTYDLSPEEISELKQVYEYMKQYFGDKEYFSFNRESMWNRSVEHLHIQFCVWRLQGRYLRNMLMNQWFPVKEYLDEYIKHTSFL